MTCLSCKSLRGPQSPKKYAWYKNRCAANSQFKVGVLSLGSFVYDDEPDSFQHCESGILTAKLRVTHNKPFLVRIFWTDSYILNRKKKSTYSTSYDLISEQSGALKEINFLWAREDFWVYMIFYFDYYTLYLNLCAPSSAFSYLVSAPLSPFCRKKKDTDKNDFSVLALLIFFKNKGPCGS